MKQISHTDLILNPDGSIYHLHLLPREIASTIILVGDPGRVRQVSDRFDNIRVKRINREFITHTGSYKGKEISVISTGIGTDNIDIVLNELDALVNLDLAGRKIKPSLRKLRIIRLGTSGALHEDIQVGTTILSEVGGGFDSLYHFYSDSKGITVPGLAEAFTGHVNWNEYLSQPYFVRCSTSLANLFAEQEFTRGITLSTPGFYAPQVRSLRLTPVLEGLVRQLATFSYQDRRVCNFEMECSAVYALSSLLGHEALTLCVAVANRITKTFLEDYKPAVDNLISIVLNKLTANG